MFEESYRGESSGRFDPRISPAPRQNVKGRGGLKLSKVAPEFAEGERSSRVDRLNGYARRYFYRSGDRVDEQICGQNRRWK